MHAYIWNTIHSPIAGNWGMYHQNRFQQFWVVNYYLLRNELFLEYILLVENDICDRVWVWWTEFPLWTLYKLRVYAKSVWLDIFISTLSGSKN